MEKIKTPTVKDLVLVGGGHSHVEVLKSFGMNSVPGVQVTLVSRDVHMPYSGMLPGLIAGHYTFDESHIDLRRLARFAGARFVHATATGLNAVSHEVHLGDRPPIFYDLLSINIGATPHMRVSGASDHATSVKPINNFLDRWKSFQTRVLSHEGQLRIGCVGAGAGGVEVLLAIEQRLRRDFSSLALDDSRLEFHLFTDADEILVGYNRSIRRRFLRVLEARDIKVHTGHEVINVDPGRLSFASAPDALVDEILWVTSAGAAEWLRNSGLDLNSQGFVLVGDTLQSTSHVDVFAAGDIAHVVNHPRPKAGVFAVRQGPPLSKNLRRALTNRPLKKFIPQRNYLSIISTGDKNAIASRGRWTLEGDYVWRLKNWIDVQWIRKYNELPEMPTDNAVSVESGLVDDEARQAISAMAMRCGGCGAKVGSNILNRVLDRLQQTSNSDVVVGLSERDDAALVEVRSDELLVQSVDFFRAFIDDAYVFGQVAANHALGDLYAMGAEPRTALALATVPYGLEKKIEDQLFQLMSGAVKVLASSGVSLVGGHTGEATELALGFTVSGAVRPNAILRKSGMCPGESLVLTKPLGTGTLLAADMRGKAKGYWVEKALDTMLQSNRAAANCLIAHASTACTDVTGFGLLGHLVEMVRPSKVDAEIDLGMLPILEGARETIRRGFLSSLQPSNVRLRRAVKDLASVKRDECYTAIFDPQTAGGLLASVPSDKSESCIATLRGLGYVHASVIGRVLPLSDTPEPITLTRTC